MDVDDSRFGFSVVGGKDEGLPIEVDEIKAGKLCCR